MGYGIGYYLSEIFNNKSFAKLKKDYKKITDESEMRYLNRYIALYGNNIRYKIIEEQRIISILHYNTIYNYHLFNNDIILESKIVFYNKKYYIFHCIYKDNRYKKTTRIIEKKWLYLYKNNKYKLLNVYKCFPYKMLYNNSKNIQYTIQNGYKKNYYDKSDIINTHYFFNLNKKIYHDIWFRYRYYYYNIYIFFLIDRDNRYNYKYITNFKYIFLFII